MATEYENSQKLAALTVAFEQLFIGNDETDVTYEGETKPSFDKRFLALFADLQVMVYDNALAFETKADMLSFGAPPSEVILAKVLRDPTTENNGLYDYLEDEWLKSTYDRASEFASSIMDLEDDVAALQNSSDGAFNALGSVFSELSYIGLRSQALTSGSALSTSTYVLETPSNIGFLQSLSVYSTGSGTLKIKKFTKAGNDFTQEGDSVSVSVVSGLNIFSPADFGFIALSGHYLGFYCPEIAYIGNSGVDDYDRYYSASGDVSSFTDATVAPAVIQVKFQVASAVVNGTAYPQMAASFDQLVADVAASKEVTDSVSGSNLFMYQRVGYPGAQDVPDGVTNLGNNEYVFVNPVTVDGLITAVEGYSPAGGMVTVYVRESDGDGTPTLSLVSSRQVAVPAGSFSVELSEEIERGQYVGLRASAVGVLRFENGAGGDSGGYHLNTSPGSADFIADNINTANRLHVRIVVRDASITFTDNKSITLANSDRIAVLGDSTSTPGFTIAGKGWMHKLSAFSDYAWENYSFAGDDFSEILARIQAGTETYGAPFQDYKATFALLNSGINDAGGSGYSYETFLEKIRQVSQVARAYGASLILATEHTDVYGDEVIVPTMKQAAQQYDALFVNVRSHARRFGDSGGSSPGYYAGFWSGVHPGIRSNEVIGVPIGEGLKALPRPKQSIKIFRPRDAVAAVADLVFDTLFERASLFKEIQIGERAFNSGSDKYYDELDGAAFSHGTVDSEYLTLIGGGSIEIDDYCLIDVILPCTYPNLDTLTIRLGDATLTAYLLKVVSTTPSTGDPVVEPIAMPVNADGDVVVDSSDLNGCMRGDRVSVIVYKSGGFSLLAPSVLWAGHNDDKPASFVGQLSQPVGAELLTENLCGEALELAEWTQEGSVSTVTPVDNPPLGVTKLAIVNDTDRLVQALDITSDDEDREIHVVVDARYFPELFDSTDTFPDDSAITTDSFDFKQIKLELLVGETPIAIPFVDAVGLWWKPVKFRSIIPAGVDTVSLRIGTVSGDLQIARGSVRVV